MRGLPLFRSITALLLLAGTLAGGYLLFRPVKPVSTGMAPDFRLATTTRLQTALSDYRGHPVLLNFFATWCTTCKGELPVIARARLKHPDLVALLIDERESAAQVRAFLRGLNVSGPALLDVDGVVAARYSISAQPVSVWIAPSGHIRAVSRGPVDAWIIDARYSELTSTT